MQRDDALRLLREWREQLHRLGVGQLYLYGSAARNEAREDSDVDLLVEPASQRFSIFDLVRVRDLCRAILAQMCSVGLLTEDELSGFSPETRSAIDLLRRNA